MTSRLGKAAFAWRAAAIAVGTVLVVAGTVAGRDEQWPFGPMSQYAFSVPPNGSIASPFVEADTVDGATVRVPLSSAGVGVRRAEIEGQLPRIQRDPSMLQALAVSAARLHPDWPRYARLRLAQSVTALRDGRLAGTTTQVLASWTVLEPHDPQPLAATP